MRLEKICELNNIETYLEQISSRNEKGKAPRREFVMVGKNI